MTIYLGRTNDRFLGRCYAISTEYSDPLIYRASTTEDAINAFEQDKHIRVSKVYEWIDGEYKEVERI